jgi:hypothetical protein
MTAPEPPPLVERRPKPRKRVVFGGHVSYSDGAYHFGCTIRDLSETGARISLKPGQPMPSSVHLIDTRNRVVHESKVVWNNGREAGLRFLNSFAISAISDPKLLYLKRLCP